VPDLLQRFEKQSLLNPWQKHLPAYHDLIEDVIVVDLCKASNVAN